jgi:hypothetical protein
MRVEIIKPFSVDSANGRTFYKVGEIVPAGQKNWADKGLAAEVKAEAPKPEPRADKPEPKSAD